MMPCKVKSPTTPIPFNNLQPLGHLKANKFQVEIAEDLNRDVYEDVVAAKFRHLCE
jgi:hypothetical protein